jgi:hypothetical protein
LLERIDRDLAECDARALPPLATGGLPVQRMIDDYVARLAATAPRGAEPIKLTPWQWEALKAMYPNVDGRTRFVGMLGDPFGRRVELVDDPAEATIKEHVAGKWIVDEVADRARGGVVEGVAPLVDEPAPTSFVLPPTTERSLDISVDILDDPEREWSTPPPDAAHSAPGPSLLARLRGWWSR